MTITNTMLMSATTMMTMSMVTMTTMTSMTSMTCMASMSMLLHVATMTWVITKSRMNRSIVHWRIVICQNGKIWAVIWSWLHQTTLLLLIVMKWWGDLLIGSNTGVEKAR